MVSDKPTRFYLFLFIGIVALAPTVGIYFFGQFRSYVITPVCKLKFRLLHLKIH